MGTNTQMGTHTKTDTSMTTKPGGSPYTVELSPPDLSAYRKGNTGIDYITTFDSGKPGPHVMVNAVTHGNELCAAISNYALKNIPAHGHHHDCGHDHHDYGHTHENGHKHDH